MAKGDELLRQAVPYVWVAEVCYKESRWLTLWTTCRLTRSESRIAMEQHPTVSIGEYYRTRVVKFERAR